MFWSNANSVANTIWSVVDSLATIGTVVFLFAKFQRKLDKRLDRIEYALWNDGQTGLVQESQKQAAKIDSIIENQQEIKTDVAVLKSRRARA